MPSARIDCFLDTNILVYAAIGRIDDPVKWEVSVGLVLGRAFGVSAQSLAEFFHVVARKAAVPLTAREIDGWIDELAIRPMVDVDEGIVRRGIALARSYGITYYDAALLAAAERHGAETFYSENLNHNQAYGAVIVVNPFLNH